VPSGVRMAFVGRRGIEERGRMRDEKKRGEFSGLRRD
jgi:hypothetical protein